jgi:hypothetical protein
VQAQRTKAEAMAEVTASANTYLALQNTATAGFWLPVGVQGPPAMCQALLGLGT